MTAPLTEGVAGETTGRRGPAGAAVLLVFLTGGVALVAPDFSLPVAVFAASVSFVAAGFEAVVFLTDRWLNPYWRWAWLIVVFDAFCLMGATATWRMLGGAAWLAVLIGALLAAFSVLGHLGRRRILQELYAPQTRSGILAAALVSLGGGGAAALVLASGRVVGVTVLAAVLLMAVLFLVTVIHATWLKIEDPAWEAARPRRRRR